jgi:magnesium chelatase subunit I
MASRNRARPGSDIIDPVPVYPFAAIVGQEEMKLALTLAVIDPAIGGVLSFGHRGTAKSTAVRGLADLLPPIQRVKGCHYGCGPEDPLKCTECITRSRRGKLPAERAPVPVVELPLGATEDRVCGTLDIERALSRGSKVFEPGLLAKANRGFLYIDEVNLLEDHLVDLLLDASASGRNVVEREGISVAHPARFVLVGSGNPEEGELRPQLLDRFGLHAEIRTITDINQRVEIVERRDRFDLDPVGFRAAVKPEQDELRTRISRARKNLTRVKTGRPLLARIAELCAFLGVDGHRGELTMVRAARAVAAYDGRLATTAEDLRRVALMSLRHRLKKDPLESIETSARIGHAADQILLPASGSRLTAIK